MPPQTPYNVIWSESVEPFVPTTVVPAGNYVVQESDGTSKITLEDNSGSILLEN